MKNSQDSKPVKPETKTLVIDKSGALNRLSGTVVERHVSQILQPGLIVIEGDRRL